MSDGGGNESGNSITENQIADNQVGMRFTWMISYWGRVPTSIIEMNNQMYHNNFINNSQNVFNTQLYGLHGYCYAIEYSNVWDNGSVGNFWSAYNGTDADGDGVGETPYVIDDNNQDNYPRMASIDFAEPSILVLSPENKTYDEASIPLIFTVNEDVAQITYSLDGEETVIISGNTTLNGLRNGNHNVTVYAMDEAGNTGTSKTNYFSVNVPFPTILVTTTAIVAVIGVGLLLYFKKRKH